MHLSNTTHLFQIQICPRRVANHSYLSLDCHAILWPKLEKCEKYEANSNDEMRYIFVYLHSATKSAMKKIV